MPEKPIRDIVFGMSAAGSLRQALNLPTALNDRRVLGCPDDLSFGPINPLDSVVRNDWLSRLLGYADESEEYRDEMIFWTGRMDTFWRDALDPTIYPVLWVCRRCAAEYAGFLYMVHGLGDTPCDVVDLTDLTISGRRHDGEAFHRPVLNFGVLSPERIISYGLVDRRSPLLPSDRAQWQAQWQVLRSDNAPLRVIQNDMLTSAPITFFDDYLLSIPKREWRRSIAILSEASILQEEKWPYHQVGDRFLWVRLRQLALDGRLEYRGDLSSMRDSEMRLP